MDSVISFITQIMTEPGLMLGFVALLGLILQRESVEKTFAETVKTVLGMYILLAGVDLLLGSVGGLPGLLGHGFSGAQVPAEGSASELLGKYGGFVAQSMLIAFAVNLLLAWITPLKYVYLSGHIIFQNVVILFALFMTVLKWEVNAATVVTTGILLGIYNTLMPAITQPWSRRVIGGNDFALAHSINVGVILAGWLGGKVGNPENSTEKLQFPKRWRFLSDPGIVAALIFLIVFALGIALSGTAYITENYSKDKHWLAWALIQSIKGSAGILIIFYGAKAMLASIVPAFRGISRRLIPNAIPALDMPVFFGYAPTALILGTVTHLVASLLTMLVLGFTFPMAVVYPAMIATFFEGGTVGIFGNATGGIRGCIISAFVVGVVDMLGLATIIPLTRMVGDWMRILALSDYGTLYSAFAWILKLFAG